MAYKDKDIELTNEFREFIKELSRRLADDSDYEDVLLPKFKELLNMTNWIIPEAWENGLGKSFKEVKNG